MKNRFISEKIEFLSQDWDLLSISSLHKNELRKCNGKKEMIQSYLNASKKMYDILKKNNHPESNISIIWNNSLCIPFLFLCRHTIELSIKYYLEKHNISFKTTHNIKKLYKKTYINNQEYEELIEAFNILDKTGTMLRYNVDNADNEFRNKPYYIKTSKIIVYVDKLCMQLLKLSDHNNQVKK